MSAAFTCITCQVAFADPNLQRDHYKTDWHRYNLKRKVAELPPVTSESFVTLVSSQRSAVAGETEEASAVRYCSFCHKNFGTANALDNHVNSKRHAENVAKHDEMVRTDTERKNAKNAAKSGFKLVPASSGQSGGAKPEAKKISVASGTSKASKFVVNEDDDEDDDDCDFDSEDEDMEEWDDTEGDPLGLEECLFCSFLSATLEDNVKHMTEVHSFFIPDIEYLVDLEGLIAYLAEKVGVGNVCLWCSEKSKSFFTVKAVQQHMVAKGHCMMLHEGPTLEEYADFYNYSSSYPDAGEVGPDGRLVAEGEAEVNIEEVAGDGYQMVLPSGATIGHRSLMRYYRQHLCPVRPAPNKKLLTNVMSHYRGLGWTGTTGEAAIMKARSISLMHMRRSRQYLRQGIVNNKVLQKHFRHQNPL